MIALAWWHLLIALYAAFMTGWILDRLLLRSWLDAELDQALEQLQRRESLTPDELGRRIRDRGDVDAAVVVLSGVAVLAVVLLVLIGIEARLL